MSDGTETDDLALVKTQLKRLEIQGQSLEQTVQQQRVDNSNLESHVIGLESHVIGLESQVTGLEQTVQGLAVENTILKNQLEISNSKWKQSSTILKNELEFSNSKWKQSNVQLDLLQNDLHKLQQDLNSSTSGKMIKYLSTYLKTTFQSRITI